VSTLLIEESKKNGGNHPAANIMPNFFIWGVLYLKNQLFNIDGREWSASVGHHSQDDCQMRTPQSMLFRMKTCKWQQNGIKISSGNPNFFWSINCNQLWLLSISWHYLLTIEHVLSHYLAPLDPLSDTGKAIHLGCYKWAAVILGQGPEASTPAHFGLRPLRSHPLHRA
jgi:hypothetical protein